MKIFQQKSVKKSAKSILLAFACFAFFALFLSNSYAATRTEYGAGRTRTCSSSGDPGGLDFDFMNAGKDAEFIMSNPICSTVAFTTYAAVKVSIANMNRVCGTGSSIPRIQPSPIKDSIDLVFAGTKAASNASCLAAFGLATTSWSFGIAQLAVIYAIANDTYKNTEVCGADWVVPNPSKYDMTTESYKKTIKDKINNYIDLDQSKLNFSQKDYREWYYGGKEFDDNPVDGNDICYDPTLPIKRGNINHPRQKYYLRGTLPGNYNCKKYDILPGQPDPLTKEPATEARSAKLQAAYNCCKKRSREYICINFKASGALPQETRFCQAGSLCPIKGITFSAKSSDSGRLICAQSYSLCPYNFTLGGGSEYCEYYQDGNWDDKKKIWTMISKQDVDSKNCSTKSEIRNSDCTYNDKSGKCKNYCQYLRHCTQAVNADYHYKSSLRSPYFSDACINFVGDSQNMSKSSGSEDVLNSDLVIGSQRHFSAPIAQCVKETLENVFYNRAGRSECYSSNEYPSSSGVCESGNYAVDGSFVFKKGNTLKTNSFFSRIQNGMQDIVKLVLTLSIIFYGMNILVGKTNIGDKKEILGYIVKIGLVVYFSTGDAWQTQFFKGVYSASSEFSQIVFKISADSDKKMRDGCQFGKLYLSNYTIESSAQTYPSGKEYLALWDTLDCKISRYLGFGPEASVANIASLIMSFYFTGTIGVYFAMAFLIFGFFFIALTIRALHIFLSSCLSIIIMVFVSPIIIPLCLFQRTANIFQEWLKSLISFCLQPMILFLYVAFFIMVIDKTMIGSASFSGVPPAKTISCKKICKNSDNTVVPNQANGGAPACDQAGQREVDPLNDSVACMINFNSYGKFHAFDFLGITLPNLIGFFSDTSAIKAKVLTILRAALLMFLLTQFIDEIPGISSALIGGSALPQSDSKGVGDLIKAMGVVASIQKRLARGLKKHATSTAKSAGSKAKEKIRSSGSKGKSVEDSGGEDKGDSDSAKDSGGGGDSGDSGGGSGDSGDSGGGGGDEGK